MTSSLFNRALITTVQAARVTKLDKGKYIVIYGQWHGISHDNPNDPYFKLDVKGSNDAFELTSTWAGDISIYNPSGRPYIPGHWGAIGKVSVVWDNKARDSFSIVEAFPGVKIVTGFGTEDFVGNQ